MLDEAGHDFLAFYIPNALAVRHSVPFLPVSIFTFQGWIGSLALALTLLLAFAPLAFRGQQCIRWLGVVIAILPGILNGTWHILSSVYMKPMMPGVYSAPLLLLSGTMLFDSALEKSTPHWTAGAEPRSKT